MNPLLKEREKELDKIIKNSDALSNFLKHHKDISLKEKELLVANQDMYNSFFNKSKKTPNSGVVEVDSEYYKLILKHE